MVDASSQGRAAFGKPIVVCRRCYKDGAAAVAAGIGIRPKERSGMVGGAGQDNDGSRPASCSRQAAGWLKVATSRPNASMWSLIEKATTAPRVVAGRPRLGTSSANTDNR